MTDTARADILARIRAATGGAAATGAAAAAPIPRDYRQTHTPDTTDLTALLSAHLTDYRAHVHAVTAEQIPTLITTLITGPRLVVPHGLPPAWIPDGIEALTEDAGGTPLTPAELDTADAVVTTVALAIAETGTLVLDGSPGQGRRVLTLIPDHHIAVLRPTDIVASLPQAVPRLDPARPLTWIAGPSATSDIELDRVEGVHGPRRLDVVMIIES